VHISSMFLRPPDLSMILQVDHICVDGDVHHSEREEMFNKFRKSIYKVQPIAYII